MRTPIQRLTSALLAVLLLAGAALSGCSVPTTSRPETLPTLGINVIWPAANSSLAELAGGKPEQNHADAKPRPTASAAKIITALVVLAKHPLARGESGPALTLDAQDVKLYERYAAQRGSVLPVYNGMVMTQRAMLTAMLLPSANNVADSLAEWAFGSMDAYREAAGKYVLSLGMTHTSIGNDASGFDPATTSTAGDLALLARAAMNEAVIAEIAAEPSSEIPGHGPVQNTNRLLGTAGIVGLKTGTSPQAGGVFMFAARVMLRGTPTTVVGAVMGAGNSSTDAMEAARILLESVQGLNPAKDRPLPDESATRNVVTVPDVLP